jgi:hypothetical protein
MGDLRRYLYVAAWALFAALTVVLAFSPVGFILLPAAVGGLVVGLALAWRSYRDRRDGRTAAASPDAFGPDVASTDVINFSRIRVSGIGGLGLVALALVIALEFERVGQTVALGAIGGGLAALGVILFRRRRGPLGSSGAAPGAGAPARGV